MKKSFMVLLMGLALTACNPFKVTDPSDPRFDVTKFKFSDYNKNPQTEIVAFQKLFPVGTEKIIIESAFVISGNATAFQTAEYPTVWFYTPPKVFGYSRASYAVIYDKKNKLLNIRTATNFEYIYPDQVKLQDLQK